MWVRRRPVLPLIGVTLWAGFWSWFSIAAASSGGSEVMHLVFPLAPVLGLSLFAWSSPRWGGLALAVAGGLAMWRFDNVWADLTMSLPAVVFGLWCAWAARRQAGRMPR